MVKLGIIGGSGLDDPNLLNNFSEKDVETPYGKPSSVLTCGEIEEVEVCILARHGKNHDILPEDVNFRANIWALKEEGCDFILGATAVGSLREEIRPGDLVFPDQFIDFTKQRKMSFYSGKNEVVHTPMSEPYSKKLRDVLISCCGDLGLDFHYDRTVVTIEGPRFSTKAESHMFRQWGADIINMSSCPEVILANELGIEYQNIAMSTDYDCWKEDEEAVTFEMVMARMKDNAEKVKELLLKAIPKIANSDVDFIKKKIRAVPDFPKPGIMFRDITTLLADSEGMKKVLDIFYERYKSRGIDVVAGIESRGFIFGSMLADKLGVGFVPIRKPGKLPAEVVSEEYELEYGTDKIEIHKDAVKAGERVLVVDDLIATGGTLGAGCNLVEKIGGVVVECGVVVELLDLKGREKLSGREVFSIVEFEESG
ncbi:S-methyl-5'-thioadenosine phosphorylase [archaeon]|jgi:5'-methylthioadenosine phosphorylase|nr:S-methyl-5'-thioadenosine phosphorylase [archaeon]